MNKILRVLRIVIITVLALALIQTLPVFMLKPFGAGVIKGQNVIVYHQREDKAGAMEVYDLLESKAEEIRKKLEFPRTRETEVYVYAQQPSLHIRKYGLITLLGAPKWYIGDNKGTKVLMVSPNAEVEVHDRYSILSAATHELVHTINFQINNKMSYWNDNGVATYLSDQLPDREQIRNSAIPSFEDLKSEDQVRFGNIGGYQFSYTYIEFLDKVYGWDKVLEMIRGRKSFEEIFSKSEREIYNEWVEYIKG